MVVGSEAGKSFQKKNFALFSFNQFSVSKFTTARCPLSPLYADFPKLG